MKPVCAIVDAFSSGSTLSLEFISRGFNCIHIRSDNRVGENMRKDFRPQDFNAQITFDGDLEELVSKVSTFSPVCVLAGSEAGVELADFLSEKLGLLTNGSSSSAARRDKFFMIETARKCGLKTAEQMRSKSCDEILNWKTANRFDRIIIKPLRSSGSEDVSLCTSEAEVREAFKRIVSHRNKYGEINSEVLAQSFLEGPEYFIDSVSLNGVHYISDICLYEKARANDRDFIYLATWLEHCGSKHHDVLIPYVKKVLDALGVRNGPAHTEVIVTNEGPALVELGARYGGGHTPDLVKTMNGQGQIVAVADTIISPDKFYSYANDSYPLKKHGVYAYLVSPGKGLTFSPDGIAALKNLKSYQHMALAGEPGDLLEMTIDLATEAGAVFLVHEDLNLIHEDIERLRSIEKNSLFISPAELQNKYHSKIHSA